MNIVTILIMFLFGCTQIFYSDGVYNGILATVGQFPFVVKLLYVFVHPKYEIEYKNTCSGSIVNKDYVLTSAICFRHLINFLNKSDYVELHIKNLSRFNPIFLRAGIVERQNLTNISATGFQERRGEGLIIHPDYRERSTMFDVDIALIKLKTPWDFNLNPGQVAPVTRWGKRIQELDWLLCTVAGFGFTSVEEFKDDLYEKYPYKFKGNVLHYYQAHVGRERYCKFLIKKLTRFIRMKSEIFDDFYVCALPRNETGRQGPCLGDKGAPLICNGIVTGLMSQTRAKTHCDHNAKNNLAFAIFTSVGADEVVPFLRKHIPDFPELEDVPPGNPFEDLFPPRPTPSDRPVRMRCDHGSDIVPWCDCDLSA